MKAFVVIALLGAFIVSLEAHKCDPALEEKIKAQSNSIPKSPIAAAIANGKEVVVATTKGYYPTDTWCLFTVFTKDSFTGVRLIDNGCPAITDCPQKDIPGGTLEPDTNTKRLHVFQKEGVTAWYKCSPDAREGEPEGLIKVAESTKDYSALIKEAKECLAGLGIKIVEEFPSACS